MPTAAPLPRPGVPAEDPSLPGLPVLLDPRQATDMIAAAFEGLGEVASVRISQVRHEWGRRVVVRYAVTVRWRRGHERIETVVGEHGPTDAPPGTTVLDDGGGVRVALWRYPFDPYLPGLAPTAHVRPMVGLLSDLGLPCEDVKVTPRAYRPTRRAVLQVTAVDAGTRQNVCYVRVLRPKVMPRIELAHRIAGSVITTPAIRVSAPEEGVLLIDPLPGRTLRDLLTNGGPLPDPALVLDVQQCLLGASAPADAPTARTPDVDRHADVLSRLLPQDEGTIRPIAARAAAATTRVDGIVHGDLYEAQLVVGDDGSLGLLDLDGLGRGSLLDDCATMLAHLHVLEDWHPPSAAAVRRWRRGYVEACSAIVDPTALRHRAAGVVLGLAAGGFMVQEDRWHATARRRLDIAVRLSTSPQGSDPDPHG